MKVSSVEEMRDMDSAAVKKYGIDEILLMENAGYSAFNLINTHLGIQSNKFLVICGSGNNGGDGMVVARKINSNNGDVEVIILSDEKNIKNITGKNYSMLKKSNINIITSPDINIIDRKIQESDIIIDAIFGTGLKGNVRGKYRDIIRLINESNRKVLSIDIPSGINGDTGEVMGDAVRADFTITFGLPKTGNLNYPGFEYCGELFVSHISFPPELYSDDSILTEINIPIYLPQRTPDSHKGSYGKTLFISGCPMYMGAPYFSSLSFLKSGGGLSYLATPESIAPYIAAGAPEVVLIPLKETASGAISSENYDKIIDFAEDIDFIVAGPGISLDEDTQNLLRKVVENTEKPILLDGDGITAMKDKLDIIKKRNAPTILTPHPGEFSRLINKNIDDIIRDRIEILSNFTSEYKTTTVLKGAHSLIGYPSGMFINLTGNPGMATAGSGDVLTGIIAAFYNLLEGEDYRRIINAARMGVFIHGLAGDIAANEIGEDGVTADCILDKVPEAMKMYRNMHANILNKYISVIP